MSIIVYWACNEREWLRAKEPEPIYKNFAKNVKDKNTTIELCPSVKDYMKNIFSIKSLYEYNFEISDDGKNATSGFYDQEFFDRHLIFRSKIDKLFSFSQNFVFFTEEKSLNMSAGILPFMEDNNITKRCVTIPGTLDIGKWFRLTDFAFYLKKDYNDFKIKEDEIFQYIKFDTKEKIIFKQFRVNEKINEYFLDIINAKSSRINKPRILKSYYSMFNHKKNIIKEIKNNLIDRN
jgi:hypothetical protein